EATGPHARVVAAGRAARARGVQPGRHTVAQARALAADLVVRARDAAAERSAARALAEVAASLASRVETAADGAVYLDVDGATHLVASERALATALVARATRVGLEARGGVAAGMTVARLGLAGIGCARVDLALGLDDHGRDARTLPLGAPTRDVKAILGCLRTDLEAHPPCAAVVHVALTAVPDAVRAVQLGLFVPPGPAPERLATTLARLAALCGPARVGAPAVVDSHRPGVACSVPFTPSPAATPERPPADGVCRPVGRAPRPPRPVEVFSERGAPVFVRGDGLGGRVVGAAGPWRIVAEWW